MIVKFHGCVSRASVTVWLCRRFRHPPNCMCTSKAGPRLINQGDRVNGSQFRVEEPCNDKPRCRADGCDFFGAPDQLGFCSGCYRDWMGPAPPAEPKKLKHDNEIQQSVWPPEQSKKTRPVHKSMVKTQMEDWSTGTNVVPQTCVTPQAAAVTHATIPSHMAPPHQELLL